MKFYIYNKSRYFTGSKEFPEGIKPLNGTTVAPNNEPNQKWLGNEWKNVPKRQKTLDELKAIKVAEATKFYQEIINNSTSDMAEFEDSTFEDAASSTPYCDVLCAARGISKEDLMAKIGTKVLAGAQVQGTLHAKLDLINAAVDGTELRAITFE